MQILKMAEKSPEQTNPEKHRSDEDWEEKCIELKPYKNQKQHLKWTGEDLDHTSKLNENQLGEALRNFELEIKNRPIKTITYDSEGHVVVEQLLEPTSEFVDENEEHFKEALRNSIKLQLNDCVEETMIFTSVRCLSDMKISPEIPFATISYNIKDGHFMHINGKMWDFNHLWENMHLKIHIAEFKHKKSAISFSKLIEFRYFKQAESYFKNMPQINRIINPFLKFLNFQQVNECLSLIITILQNPYTNFEFISNYEFPAVKEQVAITDYLFTCVKLLDMQEQKSLFYKCTEAIVTFAKIHKSFRNYIKKRLYKLLNTMEISVSIYCKVLEIMTFLELTVLDLHLHKHLEKLYCAAVIDNSLDLYLLLLKVCKISISDIINNNLYINLPFSDHVKLISYYNACYSCLGKDLAIYLGPIIKEYKERREREDFPDLYLESKLYRFMNMCEDLLREPNAPANV